MIDIEQRVNIHGNFGKERKCWRMVYATED